MKLSLILIFGLFSLNAFSGDGDKEKKKPQIPPAILQRLTPENFRPGNATVNGVQQPVEASIEAGGKRLRPILCYAAGGAAGFETEPVAPMACIAEWAHTASLMHDDIIDDSDERRGKPATWKLVGTKKAILLGDWLLSRLVRIALKAKAPQAADEMLNVIEGMVEGEFLQDELITRGTYTETEWQQVALLKTGLLFQWCMKAPFFLSPNQRNPLIAKFENFGRLLGMTFQKADDFKDRDKPGEVNAVFLEAARLEKCSPFATCFRAESMEVATQTIKTQIDVEVTALRHHLAEIGNDVLQASGRENWSPERREFRRSCLHLLAEIVEAQRVSP